MAILIVLLIATFVYLITVLSIKMYRTRDLPPMAPGYVPLFGHVFGIKLAETHLRLCEWHQKAGPIFRFKIGPFGIGSILVTGYDAIKEVLVAEGEKFHFRPKLRLLTSMVPGHPQSGVISASGQKWKEQRRLSLSVLREFGFGKAAMEAKIDAEVDKLIDWFEDDLKAAGGNEAVVNPGDPIAFCVASVIANVVLGKDYRRGDPTFAHLQDTLRQFFTSLNSVKVDLATSASWLTKIPGDLFGFWRLQKLKESIFQYFKDILMEHYDNYNVHDDPTDFMYAYIREMRKREQDGDYETLNETDLLAVVGDLWLAGMETTATTLKWCFLYMMHYPDVEEKVFQEITQVVGLHRRPMLQDRPSMPYTLATLQEIQRISSIADFTLFHTCATDTELCGYRIPAGCRILCGLYVVHMNPEYFPEPRLLKPERFLEPEDNGQGLRLRKVDHFVPFGMGKRMCLGESLARMELFKMFTSVIQLYRISVVRGQQAPSLDVKRGLTLSPYPYEFMIERR